MLLASGAESAWHTQDLQTFSRRERLLNIGPLGGAALEAELPPRSACSLAARAWSCFSSRRRIRRPRSAGMGNEPDVIAATVMLQTFGLVPSYVGFGGSSSEAWWGLFSTVR
jgi:hypothetical protein